jgi:hypothetical protein
MTEFLGTVLGPTVGTGGGSAPGTLNALVAAVSEVTGDVLPYAIAIFGILIAVSLIPRLVYKFL